jgi:zinc/manganese transport system substrate-binding protein
MMYRLVLLFACFFAGLSATAAAAPVKVVASFSILADLTRQIGGERVEVVALVPPDADAHAFQPRPTDARRLAEAGLVVANGLGFDAWIQRLSASAGFKGELLIVSAGITPLELPEDSGHEDDDDHEHEGAHEHEHEDERDPHAWQDVAHVRHYIARIAAALIRLDPAGRSGYEERLRAYDARLKALDAEISAAIARLPSARRKVVTSHDAFGYFAQRYGLTFLAPAGISNEAEASAAALARLIRQIRAEKIPAVFLENITDPRLVSRIQKESGACIGGTLYSDALSAPDGAAPTYEAMMRHNLKTLMEGLQCSPSRP